MKRQRVLIAGKEYLDEDEDSDFVPHDDTSNLDAENERWFKSHRSTSAAASTDKSKRQKIAPTGAEADVLLLTSETEKTFAEMLRREREELLESREDEDRSSLAQVSGSGSYGSRNWAWTQGLQEARPRFLPRRLPRDAIGTTSSGSFSVSSLLRGAVVSRLRSAAPHQAQPEAQPQRPPRVKIPNPPKIPERRPVAEGKVDGKRIRERVQEAYRNNFDRTSDREAATQFNSIVPATMLSGTGDPSDHSRGDGVAGDAADRRVAGVFNTAADPRSLELVDAGLLRQCVDLLQLELVLHDPQRTPNEALTTQEDHAVVKKLLGPEATEQLSRYTLIERALRAFAADNNKSDTNKSLQSVLRAAPLLRPLAEYCEEKNKDLKLASIINKSATDWKKYVAENDLGEELEQAGRKGGELEEKNFLRKMGGDGERKREENRRKVAFV
mmetsp:Transcript_2088/g.4854  ORF Transcript_2088/g.4854 Transcript_2088/m.4854 type:complete len:442 (-) Transcript_2088:170-1495(-)|eukprot:g13089.t1